jgi:hypothetical protein
MTDRRPAGGDEQRQVLASEGALARHIRAKPEDGHVCHVGNYGFDDCPHPDCVLVRQPAERLAAQEVKHEEEKETREVSSLRDSDRNEAGRKTRVSELHSGDSQGGCELSVAAERPAPQGALAPEVLDDLRDWCENGTMPRDRRLALSAILAYFETATERPADLREKAEEVIQQWQRIAVPMSDPAVHQMGRLIAELDALVVRAVKD